MQTSHRNSADTQRRSAHLLTVAAWLLALSAGGCSVNVHDPSGGASAAQVLTDLARNVLAAWLL